MTALLVGLIALIALVVVALLWRCVKLRAASSRGHGVRVYDLGADLVSPSRSYQLALYLTMKSRRRA